MSEGQGSSRQGGNQPASSEQSSPSLESKLELSNANVLHKASPGQLLAQIELLRNWARLVPHINDYQISAIANVIIDKLNAIERVPITGDESEQVAVIHHLIQLRQEFSHYPGQNSKVKDLIDRRIHHLVPIETIEGTARLPRENHPPAVTKFFKILKLTIMSSEPRFSAHEPSNVSSLELSNNRKPYRLMVEKGTFNKFKGITIRIDGIRHVVAIDSVNRATVVLIMEEDDMFMFELIPKKLLKS